MLNKCTNIDGDEAEKDDGDNDSAVPSFIELALVSLQHLFPLTSLSICRNHCKMQARAQQSASKEK